MAPAFDRLRLSPPTQVGWRRSWRRPPVVAPATGIGIPSSGRPRDRPPLRRPPTQATVASPFRPPVVAPATGIGIPSSGRPRDRPPLRRPPAQATVASPFVRLSQPAPVGRWRLGAGHGAGRRSVGAGHGAGRQPLHRPNMCRSWSVQMLGERARVRDANRGLYHFRKDRKAGA